MVYGSYFSLRNSNDLLTEDDAWVPKYVGKIFLSYVKGTNLPAYTGQDGSRKLRLTDFVTKTEVGGRL